MKEHFQGLGHIAVYTQDIGASIAFYENIGGALLKRGAVTTPDGEKKLALVDFGGVTLELIQSPTPVPTGEGNLPHFAVYVDDIDATGFQPHLVKAIIVIATEKKEVVREMLLQLITHFTKKSTITAPQFVAGYAFFSPLFFFCLFSFQHLALFGG